MATDNSGRYYPNVKDPLDAAFRSSGDDLFGAFAGENEETGTFGDDGQDLANALQKVAQDARKKAEHEHRKGAAESDESGLVHVIGRDSTLGEFAQQILGEGYGPSDQDDLATPTSVVRKKKHPTDDSGEFSQQLLGHESDEQVRARLARRPADDDSGDWLYKLNPSYWVKSPREKKFIDVRHEQTYQEQQNRKFSAKRRSELDEGERALVSTKAAQAAKQESSDLEARLQDIEAQTAGMGADEPGNKNISTANNAAKEGVKVATRTKAASAALAAKLDAGEKLSPDEVVALKQCLKNCALLKKLHGNLHAGMSGSFVGYREDRGAQGSFLGHHHPRKFNESKIAAKAAAAGLSIDAFLAQRGLRRKQLHSSSVGGALEKNDWIKLVAVASASPSKLDAYKTKNKIVLSPTQVTHLNNMVGITRAKMKNQLIKAKAKGVVSGNDLMGISWGGFAKAIGKTAALAALPIAGASYLLYKGSGAIANKSWIHRPGGGGQAPAAPAGTYSAPGTASATPGSSNAQQRIIAARRRQYDAQLAMQAAQAEASATDAEAQAQQAATEAQTPIADDGTQDDNSGAGPMRKGKVFAASDFMGAFVESIPEGNAKEIVKKAATNTPAGKKIRAGATLYGAAATGHPKAKKAVAKIQAKAKAGDPQAQADYNAVKAGKIAVHTARKAKKDTARAKVAAANKKANKKGVAVRSKLENKTGDRLARMSRKRQLAKIAHVERKAAGGDRKAKAAIARTVAKAHAGDKQAQTHVAALKLVRHVRVAGKNPTEAKNLKIAHATVVKAKRGHRKSIRDIRVTQAAAKQNQPNAKRALDRLKVAAAVERTISTGKVAPVKTKSAQHAADAKHYSHLTKKVAAGKATREEALAAAKLAKKHGKDKTAADLALKSQDLPSATAKLKDTAVVVAAAKNNNPAAQEAIKKNLDAAETGDKKAIVNTGNIVAVKTIDDMSKGLPMSPHVAEATGIVQRANAGDPEAKRTIDRAATSAEAGNPDGVKAAVAFVAAGAILASTAAKPTAQQEFTDKAAEVRGQKLDTKDKKVANEEFAGLYAKVQSGEATQSEAHRARELAMALNRPQLAAEISALMPAADLSAVLSSMPNAPLPRISGLGSVIRESLKALLLATGDPVQNYREGVRARSIDPSTKA